MILLFKNVSIFYGIYSAFFRMDVNARARECCEKDDVETLRTLPLTEHMLRRRHKSKGTILHVAARYNSSKCFTFLLESGANVLATDEDGYFPFHSSILEDETECLQIFIEKWTACWEENCLYLTDRKGRAPLHLAAMNNCQKSLALMVRYATDGMLTHRNQCLVSDTYTPAEAAIVYDHVECLRIIIESGKTWRTAEDFYRPLRISAHCNSLECMRYLLENGEDVNIRRGDISALHVAAKYGHEESMKLLLDFGADSTIKDFQGNTFYDILVLKEHKCAEEMKEYAEMVSCQNIKEFFLEK